MIFLATLSVAACDRGKAPVKPTTEPAAPSAGGPSATQGGLAGRPDGGTPAGAATAGTPEGTGPGSGTENTDKGGTAGRVMDNSSRANPK